MALAGKCGFFGARGDGRADSAAVQNLRVVDRLQVLVMRHRVEREELRRMTGPTVFVYAVDNGWIPEINAVGTYSAAPCNTPGYMCALRLYVRDIPVVGGEGWFPGTRSR